MKKNSIFLIRVFQFFKPLLHSIQISAWGYSSVCKYKISCSEYTILQIKKHGTITGLKKGFRRVLTCH
jgi:putative component of membrane protein insertase Oxa1/YidC/SpoIIIJ protein YidD